jgi:hypothetical protein
VPPPLVDQSSALQNITIFKFLYYYLLNSGLGLQLDLKDFFLSFFLRSKLCSTMLNLSEKRATDCMQLHPQSRLIMHGDSIEKARPVNLLVLTDMESAYQCGASGRLCNLVSSNTHRSQNTRWLQNRTVAAGGAALPAQAAVALPISIVSPGIGSVCSPLVRNAGIVEPHQN